MPRGLRQPQSRQGERRRRVGDDEPLHLARGLWLVTADARVAVLGDPLRLAPRRGGEGTAHPGPVRRRAAALFHVEPEAGKPSASPVPTRSTPTQGRVPGPAPAAGRSAWLQEPSDTKGRGSRDREAGARRRQDARGHARDRPIGAPRPGMAGPGRARREAAPVPPLVGASTAGLRHPGPEPVALVGDAAPHERDLRDRGRPRLSPVKRRQTISWPSRHRRLRSDPIAPRSPVRTCTASSAGWPAFSCAVAKRRVVRRAPTAISPLSRPRRSSAVLEPREPGRRSSTGPRCARRSSTGPCCA